MVIGGGSLLGETIIKSFQESPNTKVNFTYFRKRIEGGIFLDITDPFQCSEIISGENPDCVILVSAETNVDYCELNQAESFNTNVEGTRNIVQSCENRKLVYFSTDSVFDGRKGSYSEDDHPNPINNYSRTKLFGEYSVATLNNYLILRVCMLYATDPNYPKFANWVIRSLSANQTVSIATDLCYTPTYVDDIAFATSQLISRDLCGIYHVAGSSSHSSYEMAHIIARIFGFNEDLIEPVKSDYLDRLATRPKNSTLTIQKLNDLGIGMHKFQDGIRIVKKGMKG